MWLRSALAALHAIPPLPRTLRRILPARRQLRPALETLDDRLVPSLALFDTPNTAPIDDPGVVVAAPDPTPDVGANPQAIASGDFNGDGKLDLVTADADADTVSLLLGDGHGGFAAATHYAVGDNPTSIAVGDLNGDGKLDVVTTNAISGDVSVLLGTGTASFGAALNTALQTTAGIVTPTEGAVGDFNSDGNLDVVVTANSAQTQEYYDPYYGWYTYTVYDGAVSVLLGNGTGGFTTEDRYSLGSRYPEGVTVGYFNSDTYLDVVTANYYGGSVSVLLGTSTGTLGAPTDFTTNWYPRAVVAGDFTGDGMIDLVTAGRTVDVLPGFGDGRFQDAARQYIDPVAVTTADFNGDGKLDVATADPYAGVTAMLGRGNATFTPPVLLTAGTAPVAVTAGDFNGDGMIDLAAANSGSADVSIFLNDGVWPPADAPLMSIGDVTVTEGNAGTVNATFTVSLSAAYSQDVTVRYATADGSATAGSDYASTSGTLTIPAGQTSAQFSVPVYGDRVGEWDESFIVRLSDATNAFITDNTASGTIADDEPRVWIDYGPYVAEGNTGTTAATLTVHLSAASTEEVRVNFSTAEGDTQWYPWGYYGYYAPPAAATAGTDFQSNSGTLVFAPGQTEKTITVVINGDRLAEDNEVFSVDLGEASGAVVSSGHSFVTIADDEPWVYLASSPTVVEGNSGTKTAAFTFTLSAASDAPVSVQFATGDSYWYGYNATAGTDYEAATGTLTFAPGQTTATVYVNVIGDTAAEYTEYFSLNLSNAVGAHLGTYTAVGGITDDDPHLRVTNVSMKEGNSGVTYFSFTVSLSAPATDTVTVRYATADGSAVAGSDYTAVSGTLTFAKGETTKTVTVAVKGDNTKEYDEYFYLNLSNVTGNAVFDSSYGVGTIVNDDAVGNGNGNGRKK